MTSTVTTRAARSIRRSAGADEVTNVELFFDLVYVFAVTQLSQLLVHNLSVEGAVDAAVLLAMVWQVWVYTTWVVNYLDAAHYSVRLMLLVNMGGSLVLASEIPRAFQSSGYVVAALYGGMQVLRCLYAGWVLRGDELQIVFWRIICWCALSGTVAVYGASLHGWPRAGVWAAAVAVDYLGAMLGFFVPGLGRSTTTEWTISGAHFAERCQAFVLIALGESVVVIGARLAQAHNVAGAQTVTFLAAFAGVVSLWWVYFDRVAERSMHRIARSTDPGGLARSAYHWVHPLIVAGVIVTAAADEEVLAEASHHVQLPVAWLILGGTALFLAAHAFFIAIMWHAVSWPRVVGTVALLALLPVATHLTGAVLGALTLVVVIAVAVADRLMIHDEAGSGGG